MNTEQDPTLSMHQIAEVKAGSEVNEPVLDEPQLPSESGSRSKPHVADDPKADPGCALYLSELNWVSLSLSLQSTGWEIPIPAEVPETDCFVSFHV